MFQPAWLPLGSGCKAESSGFQGLGCRVWGLGFGFDFRVMSCNYSLSGLLFRVQVEDCWLF